MSPLIPGQPMFVPIMRAWLIDTVTIQEPSGPDWVTIATDVPARLIEGITSIDPVTGLRAQSTQLYVPHGTPVSSKYRIQKTGETRWWEMGGPRDYAEAPAIEIPLTAVI